MTTRMEHLDANQTVYFQRELENISTRETMAKRPPLKARRLIPTLSEVPEWALVHTWRMFDDSGSAEFISDHSADLPSADAHGTEGSRRIKSLGASYKYSVDEILYSAKVNHPLDRMRARACRRAVDTKIDKLLALGDAAYGLEGLLNLTGAGTFTPGTKTGGGTSWGTVAAPGGATGLEIAQDIMGIVSAAYIASKETFEKFVVVLPPAKYEAASTRLLSVSNGSNITALEFAMRSPHIESIETWLRCDTAGSGSATRMVAYPRDPEVVGAIVSQEYREDAPQLKNRAYVVNATAKTGGVVSRFPSMVRYGDAI